MGSCSSCRTTTLGRVQRAAAPFGAAQARFQACEARVLFVLPAPAEAVAVLQRAVPQPVLLLADESGAVRQRYAALLATPPPTEASLFFVLDRFQAPFAALATDDPTVPALADEVLEWLEFIEVQCPE